MLELVVIAELLPNRYVSQSKDAHFDLPCNASYSWYQYQVTQTRLVCIASVLVQGYLCPVTCHVMQL